MSNPPNILSTFRTYSYHHILIACDGVKTATALSESSEINLFHHPNSINRFSARTIAGGKYVVLINGMTDISFSIKAAKWATVIAPNTTAGGISYANTIETDGEIIIQEPQGIRFLNVLAETCDELETDPTGLVFVLKTIFVGTTDTGATELISTVRPFLFVPFDICAIIDQAGTEYTFAVVGVNNGVARLPQVSSVAGGFSFKLNENGTETVAQALKRAFKKLNTDYYQAAKARLKKQIESATPKINIDVDTDFREVYYDIAIDPEYEDVRFSAGTNMKEQTSDKSGQPILQFGANPTLEHIITEIMQSSAEVVAEAKGGDKRKYIFKVISGLREDEGENAGKYIIQYQVQRYEIKTNAFEHNGLVKDPVPGEFVEFDYIFTGKNTDIIDFDIKMEMGMAFFQTVATSNNIPSQKDTQNKITTTEVSDGKGGNIGQMSASFKKRPKTPLYLGAQLKDPLVRNKQFPVDSMSFNALLSRHAAFENIEAKIKIHGNPQLLDEMLPLPSDIIRGRTEDAKADQTINPNWMKTPTLIKVNIKMPSPDNPEDFAVPFWYRGFYSLFAVNNVFEEGLFTQELEMFSLPVSQDFNDRSTDMSKQENTETVTGQETTVSTTTVSTNANEQTAKQKMDNLTRASNRR